MEVVTRSNVVEHGSPSARPMVFAHGLPVDEGMKRLCAAVATHRSESVSTILDRLIRELPDPDHADDTCALVACLPSE
jgi:hypothetical protein